MRFSYVHKENVRKWQLKTLAIQQELQHIFDDHGIRTWVGGGTLIGAVREKRFLYWDNDLDMFFMHRNYKQILTLFWKRKLTDKYDIYYHKNGFWQRHDLLMKILSSDTLDNQALDFVLADLSINMFKVFAKDGVNIEVFEHQPDNSGDYVRVRQYSKHHMTRYRMIRRNDSVQGKTIIATLPNVCMLPMMTMSYFNYVTSVLNFLLFRATYGLISHLKENDRSVDIQNSYQQKTTTIREAEAFDPIYLDPFSKKLSIVAKNLSKAFVQYIRLIFAGEKNALFIAYKPLLFRFLVLPFRAEDIFPTKRIDFEGVEINVPANYKNILHIQFGNFMKPPPDKDRLALPFFIKDRMDI